MKPHFRIAAVLAALAVLLLTAAAQAEDVPAIDETLSSLTLEGEAGANLAFLSGHANLETLTLADCPAADLSPLKTCKRLSSLTILRSGVYAGADVYDLAPLKGCERLRSLTLSGACTDDLAPLKDLRQLTMLSAQGLGVSDYTPIGAMGVRHLLLSGAPGVQVAEIFAAIGRKLESADIGNCTLTPEANAAILNSARLMSLRFQGVTGIDTGTDGWKKLKNLSSLSMSGCDLPNLDFLVNFVATVIVKLDDIQIGGVTCSVNFDKYFLITHNVPSVAMLDFLQGTGRRWLYATVGMESGAVSKEVVAALAGLDSLLSLDVEAVAGDAWTEDVWKGCKNLEQLKLSGCGTVPMGFLNQLNALRRLAASGTDITQSEAIGGRALKQLSLTGCTADGWAFLNRLTDLELLAVADCDGPDSLSFAAAMPRLEILALENTPVTDIAPLTGHRKLAFVYLYGSPIGDYTPLQTLPSLFRVACSEGAALPPLGCGVRYQRYIGIPD